MAGMAGHAGFMRMANKSAGNIYEMTGERKRSIRQLVESRTGQGVIAAGSVAALYMVFYLLGIGCPIRYLTGISCAGCGMTRAYLALLHGDFAAAFYYHPLYCLVIPAVIWIFAGRRCNRMVYRTVLGMIVVLFLAVYLWRMCMGDGQIVSFHPEQNVVMRLISNCALRLAEFDLK